MTASKTLLGLLILAGGLVFYLYQNKAQTIESKPLVAAFSDNESAINDLDRVVVSEGGQTFDMREQATGWRLNDGFYVRMDSLFEWVQALKNAHLIEAKTANSAHFPTLSLTDDDLRVRLYQDQALIADIILGQAGQTPNARFVRFYDDQQTWLASGLNGLSSSEEVWQLTMIFDIPDNQVHAIEWTAAETLGLIKNKETGQWQLADETSESPALEEETIKTLAASLSGFRIQEALAVDDDTHTPEQTFVFGLDNGRQITLMVYGDQEQAFIRVIDSREPGRYKDWKFTVPEYKLSTLLMDQSALFETQQDKQDAAEESADNDDNDDTGA